MKKRILSAAAALLMLASQSVCAAADWGYDYNYDYNNYDYNNYDYNNYDYNNYGYEDNTWTDNTQYGDQTGTESGEDSSSTTESKVDTEKNIPVNVLLEQSVIKDKKFTIDLKLDTRSKITGIDLTIIYDPAVLKMTGVTANKKAAGEGGSGVAAETEKGTIQYQFSDPNGSEWKDSFITMNFEVVDPLQRSSAVYVKVNSILDEFSTILSYRADGTIVQIAGAVEYDAKDDESMYTELRVPKSDKPVGLDALGLQNVSSVQFEDKRFASSDNKSITTLAVGLTNMTVEFSDGTKKYYRLVVCEGAPAAAGNVTDGTAAVPDKTTPAADSIAADNANNAVPQAEDTDTGVIKTETHDKSKVKYLVIYILVLVAIIAVIVEFFVFYGNPYAKTAAILKQRKAREMEYDPAEEGFNGSPLGIPSRDNDNNDGYDEEEGYADGYADGYEDGAFDDNDYDNDASEAENAESGGFFEEDPADAGYDGYDFRIGSGDDDSEFLSANDAYDGYDDNDGSYTFDISTVTGYEGEPEGDVVSDDEVEIIDDNDILGDDEEVDFDDDFRERGDVVVLHDDDDDDDDDSGYYGDFDDDDD